MRRENALYGRELGRRFHLEVVGDRRHEHAADASQFGNHRTASG